MKGESTYPNWAVLLKFGEREHLEQLRTEGLLYVNHITHFAGLDADPVRSDRFEGSYGIYQSRDILNLSLRPKVGDQVVIPGSEIAGPVIFSLAEQAHCNVYCMYSIVQPIKRGSVDARNFKFGDSFVIVLNTQEFLNRIRNTATTLGLHCEWRPVEYYDGENYTGRTGPFRKSNQFSFQREFRIVFRPGSKEPLRIRIGDLRDITTPIHSLSEINELIDFSEESARRAGLIAV